MYAVHDDHNREMAIISIAAPRVAKHVSVNENDEWYRYQDILRLLYLDEERPLREVQEIMRKEYGFTAS